FEEWQRIEEKLAKVSNFNPAKKKFLDRVNYYGQMVEIDNQGRLLIPQLLRESADVKGEVLVFGNLTYLEVRNAELFRKHLEDNPITAEDEKTLADHADSRFVLRSGNTGWGGKRRRLAGRFGNQLFAALRRSTRIQFSGGRAAGHAHGPAQRAHRRSSGKPPRREKSRRCDLRIR